MNRRSFLVGVAASTSQSEDRNRLGTDETELELQMHRVLDLVATLKPGMRYEDVKQIAVQQMGLQDAFEPTFELKQCHYIKIRVLFRGSVYVIPPRVGADSGASKPPASSNPKIVSISKPFIEFPHDLG